MTKPSFDEDGKLKNKEKLINEKIAELSETYKDVDAKRRKNVDILIPKAAFMSVSMMELEKIINIKGYTEAYQNGATQSGVKECTEVKIYNTFAKNNLSYVKQLDDILKDSAGRDSDELMDFLSGGGNA